MSFPKKMLTLAIVTFKFTCSKVHPTILLPTSSLLRHKPCKDRLGRPGINELRPLPYPICLFLMPWGRWLVQGNPLCLKPVLPI